MEKADTPISKEKEKVISPKEIDTPAEESKGEPTSPTPQEKKITKLEGEVDILTNKLNKQATITKTAQRKEKQHEREMKTLQTTLEKIRSGEIGIDESVPSDETLGEKEVRASARIGIQNLFIGNSVYQKLLEKDITLREVIKNNPLALIGDFLDAEDATEQVKDKLDKMVSSLEAQPKEEKKKGEGKEFKAGPVQPKAEPPVPAPTKTPQTLDEKLEDSILGKIKIT